MKKIFRTITLAAALNITIDAGAQQIPAWTAADLKRAMDTATVPTVFNFWATFCKPCIAEMPHFQAAANRFRNRGVRLVFVSLDLKEAYPKTVTAFVKKRGISSPVVFLNEGNADLFVPMVDSTWSGAIPASLFVYPGRGYRRFVEDELSREKLEGEIKKMLGDE